MDAPLKDAKIAMSHWESTLRPWGAMLGATRTPGVDVQSREDTVSFTAVGESWDLACASPSLCKRRIRDSDGERQLNVILDAGNSCSWRLRETIKKLLFLWRGPCVKIGPPSFS